MVDVGVLRDHGEAAASEGAEASGRVHHGEKIEAAALILDSDFARSRREFVS